MFFFTLKVLRVEWIADVVPVLSATGPGSLQAPAYLFQALT